MSRTGGMHLAAAWGVLSLLLWVGGCSQKPQPDGPKLPYTQADDFKALGALSNELLMAFEATCPALVTTPGNLKVIKVSTGLSHPRSPDYGWHKGVSIEFNVSETPTGDGDWPRAAGHTCWADMGGGLKPGISIDKPSCASLCNGSPVDGFWPTDKAQGIESRAEAEETERKRISEGAAETAQLEQKARKGDYQAQRNLAYGYATGTFGSPYDPVAGCAWYGVIVNSGSPKVNSTDEGNVRVYCGKLPDADRKAAVAMSAKIQGEISSPAKTE